jgi:CDP-4-dehydro-6-deoxyglucose reductase, E1
MSGEPDELLADIHRSVQAYCRENHDFSFDPENPVVRLHEPTWAAAEINAFVDCLLTTRVTMGPKVKAFEKSYAEKFGWAHGVMVNSGSSANLLAIATLTNPELPDHLAPGDEVIVPALSWSTTVWPLIQCGLVPVVVDIDPATLNIDANEIERAIGPRTRAVLIVPVYGNPCDMDAIVDICERRDLVLIEDCCEAMGASYDGAPVGSFGRVATFSFYFSHHITTLEGGICVTNDTDFAETMRILRAHGWLREVENPQPWLDRFPEIDPKFLFVNVGYNLRATEPNGAMGSIQLTKLDGFIESRRASAAGFRDDLAGFGDAFQFQRELPKARHSWFGFPMTIRPDAGFGKSDIMDFLGDHNIETRPIICGNIARQPAMRLYRHRTVGGLENADAVMARGFSVGNHQHIDDAARAYVVETIADFMATRA